jgi:hypothetical protein
MKGTAATAAPPVPAEHGAWVVMLAPMLLVWLAFPPRLLPAMLLVVATLAGWMAQSTAPAARRAKGRAAALWVAAELSLFALCGLTLLLAYGLWHLVPIGAAAAGFAALHAWMRTQVRGRRLDRSEAGELLGVAGLVLTGPAAYVVSRGALDWGAAWIMAVCAAYFCSGVLFVQTLLRWLRARKGGNVSRWKVARPVLVYHGALAVMLLLLPLQLPARVALLAAAAFLPVMLRTLWGVAAMPQRGAPSFIKVGVLESVYAVWFAVVMSQALPTSQL